MLVPTMALQLAVQPGGPKGAVDVLEGHDRRGVAPWTPGRCNGPRPSWAPPDPARVRHVGVPGAHDTRVRTRPWEIRLGRGRSTVPRHRGAGRRRRRENELPPGTVGEAQVRGPSVCSSATPGTAEWNVRGSPPTGSCPPGTWCEVGHDGTIKVSGRKKQIIIRGGRNIDINEVEAAVGRMPGINQVCVVSGARRRSSGSVWRALVVAEGGPLGFVGGHPMASRSP